MIAATQETWQTMDYWHSIYAANMEAFFTVLSSLTEAVSVGNTHSAAAPSSLSTSSNSTTLLLTPCLPEDTFRLFSNHYLDSLFKPQWER